MIFMECAGRSCPGLARGWTGLSGCVELERQKGSNMGNVETSNNFLRRSVRGFHPRRTSCIADTAIRSPGNVSIQETQRSACRSWLDAEQGRQNGRASKLLVSAWKKTSHPQGRDVCCRQARSNGFVVRARMLAGGIVRNIYLACGTATT